MKMQMLKFNCLKCGNHFNAYELGVDSYGVFILRSAGTASEAYMDALQDSTYQEVNGLLKLHARLRELKPNELAAVLRKSYGLIACDPDQAGQPFQIGMFPKCPSCGSQEMASWEATDPPVFIEMEISPVTHTVWFSLSEAEKVFKVNQGLEQLGYLA
jgi:predicted nucleic-acid-binding Zn-ribbon protein